MLDEPANDDDPKFLAYVDQLIAGALAVHSPEDVRVFKIDNWFDHKWLGFSGKVLGMIGVWQKAPTLPPFVANRIVHQWHFRRDDDGCYQPLGSGPDIHHRGWSCVNLQRRVQLVVPSSALFWYSGNTLATGRGSLMGYIPVEELCWRWFLSLIRDGSWKAARRKNIHAYEVRLFEEAVERAPRGQ